jgi:hypothetical protein
MEGSYRFSRISQLFVEFLSPGESFLEGYVSEAVGHLMSNSSALAKGHGDILCCQLSRAYLFQQSGSIFCVDNLQLVLREYGTTVQERENVGLALT